jgi:hypothetical protein
MGSQSVLQSLLQRRETWEIAKEAYTDLQNGATIRTVKRLAQAKGFWSVRLTRDLSAVF